MVRATITGYGKNNNEVDFTEVVIHENDGKIINSKVIKWSGNPDKDSDEIMDFCSKYKLDMLCPVTETVQAEQCDCGEWIKRVVTDKDLEKQRNANV
jgi:hypothetical protein